MCLPESRSVDHRRRLGLFPLECTICHCNKFTVIKHSRKRIPEKLIQCLTYAAAEKLQEAAQAKNDESLLLQVLDTDLVAKEAHYHKSCYREYTRQIPAQKLTNETCGRPFEYKESFDRYCVNVIEKRIIEGGEVLRMNELNRIFKTELKSDFNRDVIYRNQQLKSRLQNRYPGLIFLKNKSVNACELVLSELRHVSKVIEGGSSTELSDSEPVDDCESQKGLRREINPHIASGDLYRAAMYLKHLINEIPNKQVPWPPTTI